MNSSDQTSSPVAFHLRAYARTDLDAMFRLDQICFAEPFRFSKADMRRFAEARKAQVVIARHGDELAGFSIVHREGAAGQPVGYLLTLDVAPTFRRRGLAQSLMHRAEQEAREVGCGAMLLHVFTGNPSAIALYGKLGYTRQQAAENFYSRGLHAWVYRKQLG